jgi:hypothetical protein
VKGHDFSRAASAANERWASQAAEKLDPRRFVTGHGFSLADKVSKMSRALQAAGKLDPRRFVTGHGFSRADKVSKMSRALAPANPSFAEFAFRSDFLRSLLQPPRDVPI